MDIVKKYLLWPVLVPLLALVLLEYVKLLADFAMVWVIFYLAIMFSGGMVGFVIGGLRWINPETIWAKVLGYRIATVIPTITWGAQTFSYLMVAPSQKSDL